MVRRVCVGLVIGFLFGYCTGRADAAAHSAFQNQEQAPPRFAVETIEELDCLELKVSPKILLPMRRTTIHVELRIRTHLDHRAWVLVMDGGEAGYAKSAQELKGTDTDDFLYVRDFRDSPSAPWQFAAEVFNGAGKTLSRKEASILMPSEEL